MNKNLPPFRFSPAGACFLVAAVVCALYLRTVRYDFAYDDFWQIHRNPLVTAPAGALASYGLLFTTPTPPGDLFRPVTLLSYRLTFVVFGLDPAAFHLCNVLLFAAVCLLVYRLFFLLLPQSGVALAAALFFAVHPAAVESAASIVGRAEMLAAFFGVSAALCLRRMALSRESAARLMWAAFAALLLLAAFLSKESALSFAVLSPLYAALSSRRRPKPVKFHSAAIAAGVSAVLALVCYFFLRRSALGDFLVEAPYQEVIAENPLFHLSFSQRLIPALAILGKYIFLVLFPLKLSADYSCMPGRLLKNVYSPEGMLELAVLLCFCFIVWAQRKKVWNLWGFWFMAAFALSCNFFFPTGTLMAERLLFTPAIGLTGFLFYGLNELFTGAKTPAWLKVALVLLVLFTFAFRSAIRVPVWQNNAVLFAQTALDAPYSPKAAFNYGVELAKMKQNSAAEAYLKRTLELNPAYLPAARLLSDLLLQRGALGRVEYWYRYILERNPLDKDVAEALERLLKLKTPSAGSSGGGPPPLP